LRPEEFQLDVAEVTQWELDLLEDVPLHAQLGALREDLVQIHLGQRVMVDVGWYPEGSSRGDFHVVVVLDDDWDRPAWRSRSKNIPLLRQAIANAISRARNVERGNRHQVRD